MQYRWLCVKGRHWIDLKPALLRNSNFSISLLLFSVGVSIWWNLMNPIIEIKQYFKLISTFLISLTYFSQWVHSGLFQILDAMMDRSHYTQRFSDGHSERSHSQAALLLKIFNSSERHDVILLLECFLIWPKTFYTTHKHRSVFLRANLESSLKFQPVQPLCNKWTCTYFSQLS